MTMNDARELPLIIELSGRAASGKSTLRSEIEDAAKAAGHLVYDELWMGNPRELLWVWKFFLRYPFRFGNGLWLLLKKNGVVNVRALSKEICQLLIVYGKIKRAEEFKGVSVIDEGISRRFPDNWKTLRIYPLERVRLILAYVYATPEQRWVRLVERYEKGKVGHLGYHQESPDSPRLVDVHQELWRSLNENERCEPIRVLFFENSTDADVKPNGERLIGEIRRLAPSADRFLFIYGRS